MSANPSSLAATIGGRLREARQRRRFNQTEAALRLGIDRPQLSMVECGRRLLRTDRLVAAADTFGVSLDWLAGREDGP